MGLKSIFNVGTLIRLATMSFLDVANLPPTCIMHTISKTHPNNPIKGEMGDKVTVATLTSTYM